MTITAPAWASGILVVGLDAAVVEPLDGVRGDVRLIAAADAFMTDASFGVDKLGRWWVGVDVDGNFVIGGRVPIEYPRLSQRAPGSTIDLSDLPPYAPEEAHDALLALNPFDPGTPEALDFAARFWRQQEAAHQAVADELAGRPAWVASRLRQHERDVRVLRTVLALVLGGAILLVVWRTLAELLVR